MSYICLKRDIPEGEYKTFELFGDSVIVKKEKGQIVVAKNACAHRGFKVADCAGKGQIKCKYHGQRFNYEHKYNHHEFGEFIFLPTFLGVSEKLPWISDAIGEEFGASTMEVRAPFHLWIQNTADPNHLSSAHKESFAKLFDNTKVDNVYISEFESSFTMMIKDEIVRKISASIQAMKKDCKTDGFIIWVSQIFQ